MSVAVWRKKPVQVRATQWRQTADCWLAVQDLVSSGPGICYLSDSRAQLHVTTIDGNAVWVPPGAYVVLDAKGWPYPCDAEIFEATHERVIP